VSELTNFQDRSSNWRLDAAIAMLLLLVAFVIRIDRVGFNSLSEDETAKWLAIQEYRQGHFAGVNSEHPMILKVMAWASLTAGDRWNEFASSHGWPTASPEGWLRLPNVLLGAATALILYLLCRRLMGVLGSFTAGFFWAVAPLAIALNRLVKEETPVTFFGLLACYFYCRAKLAVTESSTRRWYDLSGIAFGLAFASQYVITIFALNSLCWYFAGRIGLDRKPIGSRYARFFLAIVLTFVLVNPVVLSPHNLSAITHWLHHDGIRHTGYDFAGKLYLNFPSLIFSGMPWYFYLWLIFVKLPIPILAAVILGSVLLLRDRRTLAACFFISLGLVQLVILSVCGAKWIRYSLPFLPFLFLAGGYAVQHTWQWCTEKRVSMFVIGMAASVVFGWPALDVHAWAPYYPFYLNSFGGGVKNAARYFGPDETSEFDTREVAQRVSLMAPTSARLATARPMTMTYYLKIYGRPDIQVVPLYDASYVPRERDLIVLEPSRRFWETEQFFKLLGHSRMSHREIQVGPVVASTIYLFQQFPDTGAVENVALNRPRDSRPFFETNAHNPAWAISHGSGLWQSLVRWQP
jgi:hypothetical protein